jgi:hypothetical protein
MRVRYDEDPREDLRSAVNDGRIGPRADLAFGRGDAVQVARPGRDVS